ncbi:Lipopolysaccharide biosynthesis protein, LPS:glycosyltransferase [Sphingomonas laterariae]|uniref:Lipopolysaccharide biosynthesis protein, LPS:glycosyltransferase n=1 Tax=Edaphosphingomonas laterariae TaxID=861865 RepID=A0A239IPF5_9SPHN|nr:glycosyltransferase [Sphingomonas laterariae]SNS94294.1 Lipopolysaccharide biosynthesis protein, LPS:glycosyltransferase [Sphingomonas laterariae]
MTRRTIAIATTTDHGYFPAACCQLKSVAEHLPPDVDARLHLVCCDVSMDDIDAGERFFRQLDVPVAIIVPEFVERMAQPINRRWPRAAYLRLYFDQLFGAEFDRLVYFDADTRIRAPLDRLFGTDLKGMPVGAVHDFIYYLTGNIRRRRRELFLSGDAPYLQSGVMVFDWPATLADGALARARRFLADHPDRCQEAPDQDALNHAFEGRWTPLDPRWNLHETYLNFGGVLPPFLEHYTSTKPWSKRRPPRWRDAASWYQDELQDTIWSGFVASQTSLDRVRARLDFLKFRFKPKIRDTIAAYAPVLLDAIDVPRRRSDDKELPWAPRNRRDVEDMVRALVAEAAGERDPIRPPESVLQGYASGRLIGLS